MPEPSAESGSMAAVVFDATARKFSVLAEKKLLDGIEIVMPEPSAESGSMAAVVFDATARKFSVLAEKKLLDGIEIGGVVEYDGKQLTVLEQYNSIQEAKSSCEKRTQELSNAKVVNTEVGIDRIVFDRNGEAISDEAYSSDVTPENTVVNGVPNGKPTIMNGHLAPGPFGLPFGMNGDSADVIRDVLENLMEEFTEDVTRINRRYQELKELLVRFYGTASDGAIINTFETEHPRSLKLCSKQVKPRSLLDRRNRPMEDPRTSYFDRLVEQDNRNYYADSRDRDWREPRRNNNQRRRTATKRAAVADMDDSDDYYEPPQPKRSTNGNGNQIGRAQAYMRYPYVSREVEEEIYYGCGNNPSLYAQQLGKILFENSLHLYFKDQDPKRRDWIHEAVDFRFPSEDKSAQLAKWKNCSNSINKNMREKEKERREVDRQKPKELDYKYLSAEFENICLQRANGDPVKYAELMALKLFSKTVDKYFKEQDPVKKDWLRSCVDRRFPCHDKEKRDQRWKVCAAACNKNRTKVIGADGLEDPFPYFPKEVEEECYKKCQKIPAVYAEAMCKHLFPDTQNLLFKDQDIGKRHWLHDILDRRFPTPDKIEQIAKWKSCTSAINKNKTDANDSLLTNESSLSMEDEEDLLPLKKKEDRKENEATPTSGRDKRKSEIKKEEGKKDDSDAGSVQSMSSSRRNLRRSGVEKEEASGSTPLAPKSSSANRASARNSKKEKVLYSEYPFISEEEELDCLEKANGNPQVYARAVGRILFKDSIKLYYKDQDPERRAWMRDIVDFRFPTPDAADQKQKWKNVTAAVNKNMTLR